MPSAGRDGSCFASLCPAGLCLGDKKEGRRLDWSGKRERRKCGKGRVGKGGAEAATTTTTGHGRARGFARLVASALAARCYLSARRLPAKARSALGAVGAGQVSGDLVGSLVTAPGVRDRRRVTRTDGRAAREMPLPRAHLLFFSFSGAGPARQLAGWARAEERRRGRAVAFGEQMGALRLRCPPGRGREGDARRGQEARSSSFAMVRQGRDGKEGGAPVRREDLGGRCGRWWGWDGSEAGTCGSGSPVTCLTWRGWGDVSSDALLPPFLCLLLVGLGKG
jgi:hypothetical protein